MSRRTAPPDNAATFANIAAEVISLKALLCAARAEAGDDGLHAMLLAGELLAGRIGVVADRAAVEIGRPRVMSDDEWFGVVAA